MRVCVCVCVGYSGEGFETGVGISERLCVHLDPGLLQPGTSTLDPYL